jgi:tubulin epsilon
MNLVPFPRLNFLLSSMSPCVGGASAASAKVSARRIDQTFADVFQPNHQLLRADPRRSTFLSCALLARGNVAISDINRAVGRAKPDLRMASWNPDGFKIGLCSVPPTGSSHSVLCLANNTAITGEFSAAVFYGVLSQHWRFPYDHAGCIL